MNIKKELEEVQEENHKLFQQHQVLLQKIGRLEKKIQQNNGVIMFLQEKNGSDNESG